MAEVAGRLITDLHPNGTVRMVFIACKGGGNEKPHVSKDLNAAVDLMKTFVTPEQAMMLRGQLERDRMADAVISLEEEAAAKFRNQRLRIDQTDRVRLVPRVSKASPWSWLGSCSGLGRCSDCLAGHVSMPV